MRPLVLVTGGTGYVGGRLLRSLEVSRFRLRVMVRNTEYASGRFGSDVEVVRGDALEGSSLPEALRGVHTAFYLIHSLGGYGDYAQADRTAARNFATAARNCGVKHIVYLGGLGESEDDLSEHLQSRQEVGDVLRDSGVSVTEFQASIVIGSGSLSFEMIRALTEKLPVMVTPKWVSVPAQPIAIEDLVAYLRRALENPPNENRIHQIGGTDVVTYGDLMKAYARQRGLRRVMIPVPFLTPRLSSLWLALVTPLYKRIGRRLISSLRNSTVVVDDSARAVFGVDTMSVDEAIARALRHEDEELAATRWADTHSIVRQREWGGVRFGNRLIDSRTITTSTTPAAVFDTLQSIGGTNGWFYATWLWRLRGVLDLLAGGVGMRRGRRHPQELRAGDVVDCWRVEEIADGRLLRLWAEMRLPGRAWLEFEISCDGVATRLTQTAVFDPVGLFGLIYWYALYPVHNIIFAGLAREIVKRAEDRDDASVLSLPA